MNTYTHLNYKYSPSVEDKMLKTNTYLRIRKNIRKEKIQKTIVLKNKYFLFTKHTHKHKHQHKHKHKHTHTHMDIQYKTPKYLCFVFLIFREG